jgi:hypothetical protein
MSNLISGLAGAGGAASTAGGYYQNAANQIVNQYGSPAASTFANEYKASMDPLFQQQDQGLKAQEAALGITNSGAGKQGFTDLTGQQSAALASGVAPLYSQALGQYGSIIGEMPGAQNTAYQNAISNFYTGVQDIGQAAAGLPPTGGSGGSGQFSTTPNFAGPAGQVGINPAQMGTFDPQVMTPADYATMNQAAGLNGGPSQALNFDATNSDYANATANIGDPYSTATTYP